MRTLVFIEIVLSALHPPSSTCRGRSNSALGDWIVLEPPQQSQQAAPGHSGQARDAALYLMATIDVHEPSTNPLQCGQEINARGLEQLEAFLWAVDQVRELFCFVFCFVLFDLV